MKMSSWPTKREVERIRARYPAGTRIELIPMDDAQAPPAGTQGTVVAVDDVGSLIVSWDNGSSLNAIPGVDEFTVHSNEHNAGGEA